MPRGRPKKTKTNVQKSTEAEKQANMVQVEVEEAGEQAHLDSRLEEPRNDREEKAAKLQKRREAFKVMAAEVRERNANLTGVAREKFFAARAEKSQATRKRIQGELIFPVKTMKKNLKGALGMKRKFKNSQDERIKVTLDSAIFMSAVVEYLAAEVLELAGECTKQMKKTRIVPRHLMSAIRMDDELSKLFPRTVTFSQAGVMPKPVPQFLMKNNVPRSEWTQSIDTICRELAITTFVGPSGKSTAGGKIDGNNN